MNDRGLEQRFLERLRELLLALPYDLKVLFRILGNEDLPHEVRVQAAGAVVYCLAVSDPIPDSLGVVGFVDDVVLLRLSLGRIAQSGDEQIGEYREHFPEQFELLEDDISLIRQYLGEALAWVDDRIDKIDQFKYKGKRVPAYVDDEDASQRLYEEALEFATEYDIDEVAVAKLKSGQAIIDAFQAVRR
jgi:uncharacterized membrane protein YkvA (DUF1232 family)